MDASTARSMTKQHIDAEKANKLSSQKDNIEAIKSRIEKACQNQSFLVVIPFSELSGPDSQVLKEHFVKLGFDVIVSRTPDSIGILWNDQEELFIDPAGNIWSDQNRQTA